MSETIATEPKGSKKIKLFIEERFRLQELLPVQGDMMTMMVAKDISAKTMFSQEEAKELGIKKAGVGYEWDGEKNTGKEIEFSEAELNLLRSEIDKRDKAKEIKLETLELCTKIRNA